MLLRLLVILLIPACLYEEKASVSKSSAFVVSGADLQNPKHAAYIEKGECLIDIHGELTLGDVKKLQPQACLPSTRLSWLFRAKEETTTTETETAKHWKLAILFDTSYSLREQDPDAKRYQALKEYLRGVFDAMEKEKKITSAEIRIYPFKYCNQGEHTLKITKDKIKSDFEKEVNTLIGTVDGNEGSKEKIGKQQGTLKEYGAIGATNYLHSLSKAMEFFNKTGKGDSGAMKQVLIFSDGMPLTFNDGSTTQVITNSASGCVIEESLEDIKNKHLQDGQGSFAPTAALEACVDKNLHYPKDNTCIRPTPNDDGLTSGKNAFDDPKNHILGMIQHNAVIKAAKEGKFEVHAVLLQNEDEDKCDELCKKISPLAAPFLGSFADSHLIADKASNLADHLKKILEEQIKTLDYKYKGNAYIKVPERTEIDKETVRELEIPQIQIKVGRDKPEDEVHDYSKHPQETPQTLHVDHGIRRPGDKREFQIKYSFTFPEVTGADATKCRNPVTPEGSKGQASDGKDQAQIDPIEIHKYVRSDYTAWCLLNPLPPEPTPAPDPCETGKGGKECEDPPTITSTCTPSAQICCRGDQEIPVRSCGKGGGTWDGSICDCVSTGSPQGQAAQRPTCNKERECCVGNRKMTRYDCKDGERWVNFPGCCKPVPTTPTQKPPDKPLEQTGSVTGQENPQPNNSEDAQHRGQEGIVWGVVDYF